MKKNSISWILSKMNMNMSEIEPDFFMSSSEDGILRQIRRCYRVKRIRASRRDDYLLIRVSPPFLDSKSRDSDNKENFLVIASRHKGVSLFFIRRWPVSVYVLRALVDNPEQRDDFKDSELELIGWAEIYPSQLSISLDML